MLSQSPAIGLHLSRTVAIGSTAAIRDAHQRHTIFRENSAKGHWWPAMDQKPKPGVRYLAGEVLVRKGLKPSSLFPRLSIYVCLALNTPHRQADQWTVRLGCLPAEGDWIRPLRVKHDHTAADGAGPDLYRQSSRSGSALECTTGLRARKGRGGKLLDEHGHARERQPTIRRSLPSAGLSRTMCSQGYSITVVSCYR
jgi:hypothetical protein